VERLFNSFHRSWRWRFPITGTNRIAIRTTQAHPVKERRHQNEENGDCGDHSNYGERFSLPVVRADESSRHAYARRLL
jgi:hypothetical protein